MEICKKLYYLSKGLFALKLILALFYSYELTEKKTTPFHTTFIAISTVNNMSLTL